MIAKIEDIQYFMKDMKTMYINKLNYEGHDEFMRLLYIIEDMTPKIDLTIKKNEYKVDGKITRERRFDPDHLKNALDDRKLDINESFESRASASGSGSAEKSKTPKSIEKDTEKSEKYIPESKDHLFDFFEDRKNVHKINRKYYDIYDRLAKDNHDFTPFKNEVEEEKMHKLESHILKKFVKPSQTVFNPIPEEFKNDNNSFRQRANATEYTGDQTNPDIDNTTSNVLLKDFQEYEDEIIIPDNEMSKIKMSRNAKILMKKSKVSPDSEEKEVKMNPQYNLPFGDPIEEEKLEVKDYDNESNNSMENESKLKSDFLSKVASSIRLKPNHKKHKNLKSLKSNQSEMDAFNKGLLQMIQESFPANQIDKSKVQLRVSKFDAPVEEQEKESSVSSKSISSSHTPSSDKAIKSKLTKEVLLTNRNALQNNLMVKNSNDSKPQRKSKIVNLKNQEKSEKDINSKQISILQLLLYR